ncbi:unnamed protein product [Toxocara canis]|uniref:Uncharacterized protein n=1 Tax=Toxocara canis TaxID=6265 RepID=A0A183U5G4_TOXCA|nr:unnamed protein product [Toxocara canis]
MQTAAVETAPPKVSSYCSAEIRSLILITTVVFVELTVETVEPRVEAKSKKFIDDNNHTVDEQQNRDKCY